MRFFAPFAALLIAASTHAQVTIYQEGYVVERGVRTEGWVSLGNDVQNAQAIQFRRVQGGPTETIVPDSADGYGTAQGIRFRTGRYPVDGDTLLAFARVARDGAADLLVLATPDGPAFYVSLDRGPRLALSDPAAPPPARALAGLFAGCGRAPTTLTLDESSLAAAIDQYNVCEDLTYVAGTQRAPSARTRRTRFWGGADLEVGGQWGQFVRGTASLNREDPAVSAPSASVSVAARPTISRRVYVVGGLSYAHDTTRMGVNIAGGRILALDMLHGRLGLRVEVHPQVTIGAGGVAGVTWRRTVEDGVDLASAQGLVLDVPSTQVPRTLGLYADIAVQPTPGRFALVLRGEALSFVPETTGWNNRPIHSGHGVRTVGFGLRWAFAPAP